MTDGIIQEVFKKYHNEPLFFYGYKNDLRQLEQELIEKIKQKAKEDTDGTWIECPIEDLIGDSQ